MRTVGVTRRRAILAAGAALPGLSTFLLSRQRALAGPDTGPTNVPKQVLAFYYGWYGNPDISKSWHHWKNVNVQTKHIDESTHFPTLGAYDSHDPKIIDLHCRQAKNCGLTGFIVSWWAKNDFHDEGMPLMLDAAKKHGLKVTVYYETVPPRGKPTVDGATDDLTYILGKYAKHPAWLKVGGKPVVFVYGRAVSELKLDGWSAVVRDVNSKYTGGALLIGDQITPQAAAVFDGVHTYNPTGLTKGKSATEVREWAKLTFPRWVETAGNKISCVTIIPGYDDSVQPSRKPPRPVTERFDGETYRAMWQEAIAANPDWVLITSWNEWHEGSEIESSVELGDKYLTITREFAPKFRALKPRKTTVPVS